MNFELVQLDRLKEHEKTDPERLEIVKNMLLKDNRFKEPIIVDKNSFVVLDGHHRLNTCRQLGLKKIPCMLVDYNDKKIKVESRREDFQIDKEKVIAMGNSCFVFPSKTTKHKIPKRLRKIDIPFSELI
jgi:L-serine kinase (ADP)